MYLFFIGFNCWEFSIVNNGIVYECECVDWKLIENENFYVDVNIVVLVFVGNVYVYKWEKAFVFVLSIG